MDGYDERTYGEAFADVYDEWYADLSDVTETIEFLLGLAGHGSVLELGVGTGRVAIPLASKGRRQGVTVTGVDTSEAMLARLAQRDTESLVTAVVGDMAGPLRGGPYGLVYVAYNTLFNLPTAEAQQACFTAVASTLRPGGRFVVESFVPDDGGSRSDVAVRSISADRVVLSISRRDVATQRAEGQFVELTEHGGVRLRPWSIRYCSPTELDAMAVAAGFGLESRTVDYAGTPFDGDADRHVTVYRLATSPAI